MAEAEREGVQSGVEQAVVVIVGERTAVDRGVVEPVVAQVHLEVVIATVAEVEARQQATIGPTTRSAGEQPSTLHPTCTKRVSNSDEHCPAATLDTAVCLPLTECVSLCLCAVWQSRVLRLVCWM